MLPAVSLELPPLHAISVFRPHAWRGFVSALSLDCLQELDLLVRPPFCNRSCIQAVNGRQAA